MSLSLTGQFTGSAGTDTIVGVENLIGSNFNDFLEDNGKANRIDGGSGDDIVRAGAGKDTLIGGDGLDLLDYSGSAAAIRVDLGAGTASGKGIGKDVQSGFERVRGGQASDTLNGGAGDDTLRGGTGEDRLFGSGGRDSLLGEDGGDRLDGGAGTDALDGGLGVDTLIGGAGKDQITGGAGRDTYVFGLGSGVDSVIDFVDAGGAEDDRIDARGYDFANVRAIGKVASGDNLVLNLGGGNSVTLLQYLATHTLNQINDDILV